MGYQLEKLFPTQLPSKLSISMIKLFWCQFQQCFGQFTMLLFEGSSERELFRHLSNHVFGARNIRNKKSIWGSTFHPKYYEFKLDFKNAAKYWENVFYFRDNCIWVGIFKLSLLRTGYLSLAANMFANSRKIWHMAKKDFLSCLHSAQ